MSTCARVTARKRPLGELARYLLKNPGASSPEAFNRFDLEEGQRLNKLVFEDDWCARRVARLHFRAQRRGNWTIQADFHLPADAALLWLLRDGDEVLVPLFTFAKDIMPSAHVQTTDEKGDEVPMASTRVGRQLACTILLALAEEAGIRGDVEGHLANLTDTDPRPAAKAVHEIRKVLKARWQLGPSFAEEEALGRFANAARLFHRSVLLLAVFPHRQAEDRAHKIISFTYDAPIRLTRRVSEHLGWVPLRIAPQTIFGGDAGSYHVQLEPLEGVVIVNTRLFYAYTAASAWRQSVRYKNEEDPDRRLLNIGERSWLDRGLGRCGLSCRCFRKPSACLSRPFPAAARDKGGSRWWGFVHGSAEPMSAHARIGAGRMPRLGQGRDAVTVFDLYPSFSAVSGLVFGALANYLYLATLAIGLRFTAGLDWAFAGHPETIFIVGVLVAGLGSGLALSRSEHLITLQVARPWRIHFVVQVTAVIAALIALLYGMPSERGHPPGYKTALLGISIAATLAMALLMAITLRAYAAQRAGARFLEAHQGYARRRERYRWRAMLDDRNAPWDRQLETSSRGRRRSRRRAEDIAERYLNDKHLRKHFNRGIPAASRHERSSRGS